LAKRKYRIASADEKCKLKHFSSTIFYQSARETNESAGWTRERGDSDRSRTAE